MAVVAGRSTESLDSMSEPPVVLDGTRVLEYATISSVVHPTGRISVSVGGVPVDLNSVRGVALTEALGDDGFFVIHCDEHWSTLAAGHYPRLEDARASAESAYAGIASLWTKFRELSPEESAEVETTRKFLRELASQFPNQ